MPNITPLLTEQNNLTIEAVITLIKVSYPPEIAGPVCETIGGLKQ